MKIFFQIFIARQPYSINAINQNELTFKIETLATFFIVGWNTYSFRIYIYRNNIQLPESNYYCFNFPGNNDNDNDSLFWLVLCNWYNIA